MPIDFKCATMCSAQRRTSLLVLRLGTHARDAQHGLEVVEEAAAVVLEVAIQRVHGWLSRKGQEWQRDGGL
jgi:hypothetical protein